MPIDVAGVASDSDSGACVASSGPRQPQRALRHNSQSSAVNNDDDDDDELDHYWRRQPSDRKWGTLTVAGARLAERRARQAQRSFGAAAAAAQSPLTLPLPPGVVRIFAANRSVIDKPETHCQLGRRRTRTLPHSFCSNGQQFAQTYGQQFRLRPETQSSQSSAELRAQSHSRSPPSNSAADQPADSGRLLRASTAQTGSLRSSPKADTSTEAQCAQAQLRLAQQRFNEWLRAQRRPIETSTMGSKLTSGFGADLAAQIGACAPSTAAYGAGRVHSRTSNHHHQSFTGVSSGAPNPTTLSSVSNGYNYDDNRNNCNECNYNYTDLDEVFSPTALLRRRNQHRRSGPSSISGNGLADDEAVDKVTRNMHASVAPEVGANIVDAAHCRRTLVGTNSTRNDSLGQSRQPNDASLGCIKRNSFARSTLPMAQCGAANDGGICIGVARTPHLSALAAAAAHAPSSGGLDDYLADVDGESLVPSVAVFGSHKRRRKLPHIEAQFVIDPTATRAASGLFVRELDERPRGLPQPGQRREQRRLAALAGPGELAQVQPIEADEKVETYLRHYEARGRPTRAAPPPPPPTPPPPHPLATALAAATTTPAPALIASATTGRSPTSTIELDQLEEVTFQPYYNLPALKYSIQLPLRRTASGRLLFDETTHLRCARRLTGKARLGSSSSCPARANCHVSSSGDGQAESSRPRPCLRRSLDSTIDQPTVANRPIDCESHLDDSLEDTTPLGEYATVAALTSDSEQAPVVPPHASEVIPKSTSSTSTSNSTSTSTPNDANNSSSNTSSSTESPPTGQDCCDQSVDENYEFDQMSSCSSSQQVRRRLNSDHALPGEYLYAQVNKSRKANQRSLSQTMPEEDRVGLSRSRFYDFSTQKEQVLHAKQRKISRQ